MKIVAITVISGSVSAGVNSCPFLMKNLKTFCSKAHPFFLTLICTSLAWGTLVILRLLLSDKPFLQSFLGAPFIKQANLATLVVFYFYFFYLREDFRWEWGLFPNGRTLPRAQGGKPPKWSLRVFTLCFLIPGAQVLDHTAGSLLITSLTNGCTNCCSRFASSILSVVKSIPLIMFAKVSFQLAELPLWKLWH